MEFEAVKIEDLTIGYSKGAPLAEIPSLRISTGEIIAITGPSGLVRPH